MTFSRKSYILIERLEKVGIVYGKDKILTLRTLRAGKGQGQDSFPERLAHFWLERELGNRHEDNPLDWRNCKDWIIGLRDFQDEVAGQLNKFKEESDGQGLGFKERNFPFNAGTLQRKRLPEWKKWWKERQRRVEE